MKYSFTKSKIIHTTFVISVVFISFLMYAYSTGITGKTLKNGTGCTCHDANPTTSVNVVIEGPDTLLVNQTATYTVKISGGPLTRGGTNIAASAGTLITQTGLQLIGDELTHTSPKAPLAGEVTFSFSYKAPNSASNITLYANGNSVNFNGGNDGDDWNFAQNKIVHVVTEVPVELTSFSAVQSKNLVKLNWSTATEKNNFGFEVFRSEDNSAWEKIGFVKGNGTTTEKQTYSFDDQNSSVITNNSILYYKLRQVDFDGSFAFSEIVQVEIEDESTSPKLFALHQNYPNPFNPSTKISFELSSESFVTLKVYDILGNEIATLIENELVSVGRHEAEFNINDERSTNIYLYKLQAGDFVQTKKMILMK